MVYYFNTKGIFVLFAQNKAEADGGRLRVSAAMLRESNGGEPSASERSNGVKVT